MSDMQEYQSRQTVKARQVTDENGENVVTANGNELAEHGDYVVDYGDGDVRVVEKQSFEDSFTDSSVTSESESDESTSEPDERSFEPDEGSLESNGDSTESNDDSPTTTYGH